MRWELIWSQLLVGILLLVWLLGVVSISLPQLKGTNMTDGMSEEYDFDARAFHWNRKLLPKTRKKNLKKNFMVGCEPFENRWMSSLPPDKPALL